MDLEKQVEELRKVHAAEKAKLSESEEKLKALQGAYTKIRTEDEEICKRIFKKLNQIKDMGIDLAMTHTIDTTTSAIMLELKKPEECLVEREKLMAELNAQRDEALPKLDEHYYDADNAALRAEEAKLQEKLEQVTKEFNAVNNEYEFVNGEMIRASVEHYHKSVEIEKKIHECQMEMVKMNMISESKETKTKSPNVNESDH